MNTKVWTLYKQSKEGKKLIDIFNPDADDTFLQAEKVFKFAQPFNAELPVETSLGYFEHIFFNVTLNEDCLEYFSGEDILRDDFIDFISCFEVKDLKYDVGTVALDDKIIISKENYRSKARIMDSLSLVLFYLHPFFKPVIYPFRFDVFQRNCNRIGIELPEIPRSSNYMEYPIYYYDICVAINDFQNNHQLTDSEMCACIYGCAELLIDNEEEVSALPKPVNVWLTGAGKHDYQELEKMEVAEHIWACNERTRRGDIVVIYCKSPYSFIHSIWRASSEGIFNPFDYYHCRTLVSSGIKVPKISYHDLKEHPYFSNVPIVRKNLQGLNGVELTSRDYTELLSLIESKGGDISVLPKLFEKSEGLSDTLRTEKDVENNLLIPLIEKLGYSRNDWTRQAMQKAGRNLKAIPDFVFFPKGMEHFQNAPFLIEAKYSMASVRELKNAFEQAVSYARIMQCKVMGICDKERLIIYRITHVGTWNQSKPVFENHWEVINNDADVYAELVKIIAPEIIQSLQSPA